MKRASLWSILFLFIAGILGAFAWSVLKRPAAFSSQGPSVNEPLRPTPSPAAPSFLLTDQTGRPFDSARLKGHVWVADFIFTSCAGSCPQMSEKMSALQKQLPEEIRLVSITVDPKRDTPAALAEYGRRYGAREGRWIFLTGPADEIAQIVQKGFLLSVAEGGSPEEPVTHSSRFVLVDRAGGIRGYYDSTDPNELKRLIRDAGSL